MLLFTNIQLTGDVTADVTLETALMSTADHARHQHSDKWKKWRNINNT